MNDLSNSEMLELIKVADEKVKTGKITKLGIKMDRGTMLNLMETCWRSWNDNINIRNDLGYINYHDYLLDQMERAGMLPPFNKQLWYEYL